MCVREILDCKGVRHLNLHQTSFTSEKTLTNIVSPTFGSGMHNVLCLMVAIAAGWVGVQSRIKYVMDRRMTDSMIFLSFTVDHKLMVIFCMALDSPKTITPKHQTHFINVWVVHRK